MNYGQTFKLNYDKFSTQNELLLCENGHPSTDSNCCFAVASNHCQVGALGSSEMKNGKVGVPHLFLKAGTCLPFPGWGERGFKDPGGGDEIVFLRFTTSCACDAFTYVAEEKKRKRGRGGVVVVVVVVVVAGAGAGVGGGGAGVARAGAGSGSSSSSSSSSSRGVKRVRLELCKWCVVTDRHGASSSSSSSSSTIAAFSGRGLDMCCGGECV